MRITILAGKDESTAILINSLLDAGFDNLDVVLEKAVSRKTLLLNRARRLGWWPVFGQILFIAMVVPLLRKHAKQRRIEILSKNALNSEMPNEMPKKLNIQNVDTINGPEVIAHLVARNPDAILVNGTRIIKPSVLQASTAPMINTHAGITPKYRGVHGGYWSLWCRDIANFGVTVHLVDSGVDTGAVLCQARPRPTRDDNFTTYPILQQAASFSGLLKILSDLAQGKQPVPILTSGDIGQQWYHPTLWQYIIGFTRGVK